MTTADDASASPLDWVPWAPPVDIATLGEDAYGGISRYVVPAAIEGFRSVFPSDLRQRLERDRQLDGAMLDRTIALRLYDGLRARGVSYAAPKWSDDSTQPLRDPAYVLGPDANGTCLDLALLFAAACVDAGLGETYLVMLRHLGPPLVEGGEASLGGGHAGVAIRLRPAPLSGREQGLDVVPGTDRVLEVHDPEAFRRNPDWLLLDPTSATRESTAEPELRLGAHPVVHLVRCAPEQARMRLPETRGALRQRVPAPDPLRRTIGMVRHTGAVDESTDANVRRTSFVSGLARSTGVVVLTGDQGIGKSRLALEAARLHDFGFGWALRGSSVQALHASLAAHEAFERGEEATTDAIDAPYRARAAWQRLVNSDERWVVVLDNLHYESDQQGRPPAWVRDIPVPGEDQLLLVTTNLAAEDLPASWRPVPVPAPEPSDVDPAIREAARGSLVLVRGLDTLIANHPDTLDPAWAEPPADLSPAAGAEELWRAAGAVLSDEATTWTRRAAFLPPDEVGVLPDEVADELVAAGLVTRAGELDQVHRIIGAAVRASLDAPTAAAVAGWALTEPAAKRHLLRRADLLVSRQLAKALENSTHGASLCGLGAVQEVYEPARSVDTYVLAEKHLDADRAEDRPLIADCLHARARRINQNGDASMAEIQAAIQLTREAVELRSEDDLAGRYRHEALQGNLIRRSGSNRAEHDPLKKEELVEAMTMLDNGHAERLGLGVEDALGIDRALFNKAGPRINLAQLPGVDADTFLTEAEEVYDACAAFRKDNYGTDNPLTASAVAGQASIGYLRALLGLSPEPRLALEQALDFAVEALRIRVALDLAGDIVKSSDQVMRIGALMIGQVNTKQFPGKVVDMVTEIRPRLD